MKIRVLTLLQTALLLGFATIFLTGCGQPKPSAQTTITISAAASLKDVVTKLEAPFAQQHPEIRLQYNFASSGTLQRQIEQGAPVDVYFAAAARNMDELERQNLILSGTRSTLAGNALVLIVPQASRRKVERLTELTAAEIQRIAIAAPASVPAGQYTREVLQHRKLWKKLQPKMVQMRDVREVLAQVELGNVEAGFVYATDARISPKVRVALVVASDWHQSIVYPAAVIRSTRQVEAARAYVTYLSTPAAQEILQLSGFPTRGRE